jgi:small subunit ribosomal protein S7e
MIEGDADILERIEKMPLFMEFAPEGSSDNPELEAIRSLQREETPEEIAENYKQSGNEAFKLGKSRYGDALRYYDLALEQKCDNATLNATVLSNRAQVHIALGNYGHAITDCTNAIKIDSKNFKAYYRAAISSFHLGKYNQAINYCRGGIMNTDNPEARKPFRALLAKIKNKTEEIEERAAKEKILMEEKEQSQNLFSEACELRGIKYRNSGKNSYQLASRRYEAESYYDAANFELHWPVLILYPQFAMSDFVRDWNENSTIEEVFQTIFPSISEGSSSDDMYAPWDTDKKFYLENLNVSIERSDGTLVSVTSLSISLKELLSTSVDIVDSLPVLHVSANSSRQA